MIKPQHNLTLIDAINQFWAVARDGDRRSLTSTGLTYFYLANVWNARGRPISFGIQNKLICAELNISKPTLERHRNVLKQLELIDFFSRGKGDPNIQYQIGEVKKFNYLEVKKEKILSSIVTSPLPSDEHIKQSKSAELFVEIDKEVKNFYYLQNLFSQDAGLLMRWAQYSYPADQFDAGLELWMIQNHGQPYHDFHKARNHFLFWMPNYFNELDKFKQLNDSNKSAGFGGTVTAAGGTKGKSAGFGILSQALQQLTG